MGLDISAYEFLEFDRSVFSDDTSNVNYLDELYDKGLNAVLIEDSDNHYNRLGGMKPGIYQPKYPQLGHLHFRAGSYGTYNGWRNTLSEVMCGMSAQDLWEDPEGSNYPFYELIHFSDCEGVIAGQVAEKLADDFSNHFYKAIQYAANFHYPAHPEDSEEDIKASQEDAKEEAETFLYKYVKWMVAFQMASNSGAVIFS